MQNAGLYIHVPFCMQKCPYCNFYSVKSNPRTLDAYAEAVVRNILHYSAPVSIDTVYFGGGTPSILLPSHIEKILVSVSKAFLLSENAEITLEANPAMLSFVQLQELRRIGVNRLSLGVQSLDDVQLRRLGRLHTAKEAVRTVDLAAKAGFHNISCDVMLALPQQTKTELNATLRQMTSFPIQHISAYLLKVEAGTPFAKAHIESFCPDEDCAADLYLHAVEQLQAKGYLQYEISNFAIPGFESRHNCKYWRCVPYLGIGPSAHSCWNGKRFFVPSSVAGFLQHSVQPTVLEDAAPCTREERLMLQMRMTEGAPLEWLSGKESFLEQMCSAGLMQRQNNRIRMTPAGFLVSNSILAKLL